MRTIGDAQLYLGDCLELLPALADGSADMVLCDLPYGTTQNNWDSVIPFAPLWAEYWRILKPTGVVALTAQSPFDKALGASQMQHLKYEWIWEKFQGTGHLNAKKQPMKCHENVLIFYRKQCSYNPQMTEGKPYTQASGRASANYGLQTSVITENKGERYPRSVLKIAHDKDGKVHPTQKPVALMEYLIRTYTNPGDLVLDNTMGSGTTGVACANTGRRFVGMEMDPAYFDIAAARIAEAHGNPPVVGAQPASNNDNDLFGAAA